LTIKAPKQFYLDRECLPRRAGNVDNGRMDSVIQEKVLAVARAARGRTESLAWFRVSLGLYYLAGLMTPETIDFKQVDREFNRFIYHSIGKGHSIASVLQFMSGAKVVEVVASPRFIAVFSEHCPEVPVDTIGFLLSLNLSVAKSISKLDIGGALLDWIELQADIVRKRKQEEAAKAEAKAGASQQDDPVGPGNL
jgi:hypothetical protein